MARYIDADKLKEAIKDLPEQERIEYMGIYDVINFQPTADVQEVKHGKWLGGEFNNYSGNYEEQCSVCGKHSVEYQCPYCPNCGAKMDKECEK